MLYISFTAVVGSPLSFFGSVQVVAGAHPAGGVSAYTSGVPYTILTSHVLFVFVLFSWVSRFTKNPPTAIRVRRVDVRSFLNMVYFIFLLDHNMYFFANVLCFTVEFLIDILLRSR